MISVLQTDRTNCKTNLLKTFSILIWRKFRCAYSGRVTGQTHQRSLFFALSLWARIQNVRSHKRIILRGNYAVGGWLGFHIPRTMNCLAACHIIKQLLQYHCNSASRCSTQILLLRDKFAGVKTFVNCWIPNFESKPCVWGSVNNCLTLSNSSFYFYSATI
jgi:hypothetical protein